MLDRSFLVLRGIGEKRERELWRDGLTSWNDLETLISKYSFLRKHSNSLQQCKAAMAEHDACFFAKRLPTREHYRIALAFPTDTLFLDIETTGLSLYYDYITLVGWSIGSSYDAYITDTSSSTESLRVALSKAKAIVTFNGSLFDLPFIRQEFSDITLPTAHIDLRFLARRAGLGGSQKKIEKSVGYRRQKELRELDGRAAPLLWHRYRRGDIEALKLLVLYNHADIQGMKSIFGACIKRIFNNNQHSEDVRPNQRFVRQNSPIQRIIRKDKDICSATLPASAVKHRQKITYSHLAEDSLISKLCVVGIDLTGSERRPSGWCILRGNHAESTLISLDDDLVQRTLERKPHLISIDSPLSLPEGRLRVTDDDPGRVEYGITRVCERILRKRGVHVYPCLLPSMQRLTERGMQLAARFRKLGIPVIESYPGAAQDILQIPRKRASLNLLRLGLEEFGLRGHWTNSTAKVAHDELDAITSALVGLFFWTGRFEALGNEKEGFLIVPDINRKYDFWLGRRVIGLSGPIAAGKTTAAKVLEGIGFQSTRFSLALEDILDRQGLEVTRGSLQKLGDEIHNTGNQRWLCRQLPMAESHDIVIDGVRHPDDRAYFIENFGPCYIGIYIDAPLEERLARYCSRGGGKDEFFYAIQHSVEGNVRRLRTLAPYHIDNTQGLAAFGERILKLASFNAHHVA